MRALLLVLLASPALAETRCGWIDNPTPGNWWLTDADGEWVLSTQGAEGVPGMDLVPDLTTHDWVETNGGYGYGCACIEVETRGDAVLAMTAFAQEPLSACQADPALPAR